MILYIGHYPLFFPKFHLKQTIIRTIMESEELKKLQAPLKDKYREQPESAIITLKAEGKLGEGISCKVET